HFLALTLPPHPTHTLFPYTTLFRSEHSREAAAKDGLELQIGNIWERVLGIRPIRLQDNFFELGGHSLLAVRLFTEMEKVFGKTIPLAILFKAPTIKEFAKVLRRDRKSV